MLELDYITKGLVSLFLITGFMIVLPHAKWLIADLRKAIS